MSIRDFGQKIKGWGRGTKERFILGRFSRLRIPKLSEDIFLVSIIILVAFGSFGLGRLSKIEGAKVPIRIERAPEVTAGTFLSENKSGSAGASVVPSNNNMSEDGQLVGSKTGTKYHYPWCGGASRIAPANRVHFASKADAEAKGYTPAANCKGL